MRTPIVLLLCAALGGCVLAINHKELEKADYGPRPSLEEINAVSREWFHHALKDPESAQITMGKLQRCVLRRGSLHYGWAQFMEVNAKNSYGGYTGFKPAVLFIENGRVLDDIWYAFRDTPNPFSNVQLVYDVPEK